MIEKAGSDAWVSAMAIEKAGSDAWVSAMAKEVLRLREEVRGLQLALADHLANGAQTLFSHPASRDMSRE